MARRTELAKEPDQERQLLALSAHLRRMSLEASSGWMKEHIFAYTARSIHWHWWDSALWREFRRLSLFADTSLSATSFGADFQIEDPLTPTSSESATAISTINRKSVTTVHDLGPKSRRLPVGLSLDLDGVTAHHHHSSDLDDSCLASSPPNSDEEDSTSDIINVYLDLGSITPAEGAEILLPVTFGQAGTSLTTTNGVDDRQCNIHQFSKRPGNFSSGPRESKAALQLVPESPLQRLVEDLTAVSKIIEQEDDNEGAARDGSTENTGRNLAYPPDHLEELAQIVAHNDVRPPISPTIEVLSNPSITSSWIRERLQDKWQKRYKPALTARLATLVVDVDDKAGIEAKKCDANEELERKKQKYTKLAISTCAQEQLGDVQRSLDATLVEPFRELKELQVLFDAQQYLLLREHFTFSELLTSFIKRQEIAHRRLTAELPLLEFKLQALSGLLDVAARACSSLETRINRLSAKDVPAGEERNQVRERRLGQPEALVYLSRAAQDIQIIRDHAQAVRSGMDHVEVEVAGLAERSLELYVTCKGCFYFAGDDA